MVTTERCETKTNGAKVFNECGFVDTLRLSFSLSNDKLSYVADVNLVDCNQDGEFTGEECELSNQVSLYDNSTVTLYNTTGSTTAKQSLTLSNDKAKQILSTTGLDLLKETSYEQTNFANVAPADFKINNATWLTGLMEGRITVRIKESTT
jgi:hypothetical protein